MIGAKSSEANRVVHWKKEQRTLIKTQLKCDFYRRQTKFGKVMFLHVSVILFTGGVVSQNALQVSSPTPKGMLRGLAGGVSRPTPRRRLRGLAGGLQAHMWGGVYPSLHWGRHPQQMATAVGSTHPTGMHSCLIGDLKSYLSSLPWLCINV